jgi:ribosomal protein L17
MVRSALVLLALLAGCTTSPITGRDQYMVVSEAQAVSQSAAAYSQMMADLGKKKKLETGTPRAQKVREITDKLVKEAVRVRPDASSWAWGTVDRQRP